MVSFAAAKSDVIAKLDGSFVPRPKRKVDGPSTSASAAASSKLTASRMRDDTDDDEEEEEQPGRGGQGEAGQPGGYAEEQAPAAKRQKQTHAGAEAGQPLPQQQQQQQQLQQQPPEPEVPNRMLFVSNLPPQANELMLAVLFRGYEGFQRAVQARPGIAFIEFRDELGAAAAREALNGFEVDKGQPMVVQFAKQ